jgi:hypothetical protein
MRLSAPGKYITVLRWALVCAAALVVAIGQALLIGAAWRLRRRPLEPPPGVPRSDPRGDLAWTLLTAATTAVVFGFVFQSLL